MNERERLEKLTRVTLEAHDASERFCKQQLAALRQALQHQRQEPVAYLTRRKIGGTEGLLRADMVDRSAKNQETHDFIPLYTHPPQRTWIGLSDAEVEEVSGSFTEFEGFKQGALWAEQKLKELNA
ncbi:hypothetical protein UFOVP116_216 [uncultured Caudovirales phage]|uniref:Uncharacterized protein n=1 Tax=uncultured Caudovirales phage TaxID=2100421 RepID=A0A6J5L9J5_9CAUD|nr:hypothetical protein UFOVP116_216 [uncultured Caudovirales phage]